MLGRVRREALALVSLDHADDQFLILETWMVRR
jgi:hypothetical protein